MVRVPLLLLAMIVVLACPRTASAQLTVDAIDGAHEREAVETALATIRDALVQCLTRAPATYLATIDLGRDGRVARVRIEGGERGAARCFEGAITPVRFGPASARTRVRATIAAGA